MTLSRSVCCGAPLRQHEGEEGTQWRTCSACERPADAAPEPPVGQGVCRPEDEKPRQFPEGKSGEESLQLTAFAGISPEALEHIRQLIVHRPDQDELRIVLMPERCPLCEEIASWGLGR